MHAPLKLKPSVKPPKGLSRHAKEEWLRVASALDRSGRLTDEIIGSLTAYCSAVGTIRECDLALRKQGMTIVTPHGLRAHPLVSAKAAATTNAAGLAQKLGLFGEMAPKAEDAYGELGIR